jgi:hypothetical protein
MDSVSFGLDGVDCVDNVRKKWYFGEEDDIIHKTNALSKSKHFDSAFYRFRVSRISRKRR